MDDRGPIAACHQPNFFPWLGYFHKIRWSDTFVFLDDVLLQKTRGSVTNRVAIAVAGAQAWLTAPLDRAYTGNVKINEARFAPDDDWRRRATSTLKMHYGRTPHFKELGPLVLELVNDPEPLLAEFNMKATAAICDVLELRPRFVRASAFGVAETSSARLAELVERVGARTYLAGAGARAYQDDAVFHARGLEVRSQGFSPPRYLRAGKEGLAGLSVLDALFWLGAAETRALLEVEPGATGVGSLAGGAASNASGGEEAASDA